MNHDEYRELLSALLDGELDDAARERVLAHLSECETCRTYFAELTAMRDALGDMEPIEPPADFAQGVLTRLHEEAAPEKPTKKAASWRKWGALAACAAVVVLGAAILPNAMRMGGAAKSDSAAPALTNEMLESSLVTENTTADADEEERAMDAGVYAVAQSEPAAAATSDAAMGDEAAADPATANGDAEAFEYVEGEAPVLTLYGAKAAQWLGENGEWDEDYQAYWVEEDALAALPDGMVLYEGYGEVDEVYGTQLVRPAETEAAP